MADIFDARLCELGEGPLWHPERRQLFWFDILGKRLLSRDGDKPLDWSFDEHVSAAGWIDRDTLLIASETGLYRFAISTGAHELLHPLEADDPTTRSNDGRADPQGGFWIGTMDKAEKTNAGAIYRLYRGEIRRLFDGIAIPNAICFAPDGQIAYFADTPRQKIMRQPLDASGWPAEAPEVFVDLTGSEFFPDGSVCDAEGGVWNAQWGAGRVARYTADGRFDRAICVAGTLSSCPAFGGENLATLYATTARKGLTTPDAAQGCVYETMPGIRGIAEAKVVL